METTTPIDQLRAQERALAEQITELEQTAVASSTPGIREFRLTRLRQIEVQRDELSHRLRRLESSPMPATEAYMLQTALREANLVAQGTFR